ncbi:MAG TPA: Gfo/Idh/MocA family oxidoreductase [Verrucomicrobiae bacterium]|nr:Gfo/Idh/MocA family oxidoreductase [Verrucomicrobiae bacterium]
MSTVRLGIVGLGNIGSLYAKLLLDGKINRAELVAACSRSPDKLAPYAQLKCFPKSNEMIRSGAVDAVLIATPHYSHTPIGIDALQQGLHVLVEKPISAHKADCERLLAAHTNKQQVFGVIFNQRTNPFHIKIHDMVHNGELGEIRRVNWIVTSSFRPEVYYASGGWRATWRGEGGGVLLNQASHNLDLLQWIFGMPKRVRAFCGLGRYHQIEVEDDVTAYLEYLDGTTGIFITSTGEAPGTSRLDVTAEGGKLVHENDTLTFVRNEVPTSEFSRTATGSFDSPPRREIKIALEGHGGQHAEILQNFVDAILDHKPLIAPAVEGIRSVELGNAMLLSSLQSRTIELPMNSAEYEKTLKELIRNSKFTKPEVRPQVVADMSKSFRH